MKRILMTAAAIGIGLMAHAEPLTIYTGGKGGGYDGKAREIAQRLAQRGYDVEVENRNGSDDITLQSCQNDVSMWISQIDAIYTREMKDGCYLPVVADYGSEVAAIFFWPSSRLDELSDLDDSHTVFVDKVGSGSELTWRTMVSIEQEHGRSDDWTTASVMTGDLRRATALANRGKLHAVLLVRKTNSKDFERLLDAGWELGELYDKDINDLEYGTKALYEGVKVNLTAGGKAHRDYGYIVRSFIGTTETVELEHADLFDAMLGATE